MTGTGLVTSDQSATLWYWIACMVLGMVKVGSNALGMIACVVVIDILVAVFAFLPLLKVNRIKKKMQKKYTGVNSKRLSHFSTVLRHVYIRHANEKSTSLVSYSISRKRHSSGEA